MKMKMWLSSKRRDDRRRACRYVQVLASVAVAAILSSCSNGGVSSTVVTDTSISEAYGASTGQATPNGGSKNGRSGNSPTIGSGPGQACGLAFNFHPYEELAAGKTPQEAVQNFILHGSVSGSSPGRIDPVKYGVPKNGWQGTKKTDNAATFMSGKSVLYLTKLSNGSWEVEGGEVCR
jgi:hypothetical protein